jgi:hypothetical protein
MQDKPLEQWKGKFTVVDYCGELTAELEKLFAELDVLYPNQKIWWCSDTDTSNIEVVPIQIGTKSPTLTILDGKWINRDDYVDVEV